MLWLEPNAVVSALECGGSPLPRKEVIVLITENKDEVCSRAYRLIRPGHMEETFLETPIPEGHVVIEPTLASICHADLRYYTGQRRPEALAKKLPMALLHEGVGRVVHSTDPELQTGERVVIVPNIPGYMQDGITAEECCPVCKDGPGGNYCSRGYFLGSGIDGIAQNRLVIPASCAIPIPADLPDEIAVLSELCSVSYQALQRVRDRWGRARAAVFGDGPVGYLTASMIHHLFGLDKDRLKVFGADPNKIDKFHFADCAMVQEYDFAAAETVDIAVECTGGRFSESAVNQAIDILNPGGILILMGVTEERVPINTRDVLEKGLTLIGSSRSYAPDYYQVLEAMKDPSYQQTLRQILPEEWTRISKLEDYIEAMNDAAEHRGWKKTVLAFQW